MPQQLKVRALSSLGEIDPVTWDALNNAAGGSVLTSHHFLSAFEASGSVCPETGWQPQHLVVESVDDAGARPIAAVPLYVKGHSYGEFVFDWAWADAYERHGLRYYPKWLCAVPFTPASGPRLLSDTAGQTVAAQALLQWVQSTELSSLHVLYTCEADQDALLKAGCLPRTHTQFHWQNPGWGTFDHYLQSLTQPKRKKIRAERRKVREAGVTTSAKSDQAITESDWDFFYRCYENTYAMRGNRPYLTREFFSQIDRAHCLLIEARIGSRPFASSLLWIDTDSTPEAAGQRRLYGRYWGALEAIDCLHFEVAYYAPIEWAIVNGIAIIEGGAQGEHKLARGFTPVQTQSAHWLAHPRFAQAVEQYLEQERQGVESYTASLRSPFRTERSD